VIVVDANILAYYFVDGPRTAEAVQLFRTDSAWVVPALWQHEFMNILATMGKSGTTSAEALATLWSAASLDLAGKVRSVSLSRALELALELRVSGYDAQYLALAESLGVPCISEDARLVKASRGLALSMKTFLETSR
jgi:predicted nucleic acid-binding protein